MIEDGTEGRTFGLPTDMAGAVTRTIRKSTSRRRFMGMAGLYMAGAMSIEALIAACSGTSNTPSPTSSQPAAGGIKVINFFTTEDDPPTQANLKAAIDAFEAKYPDVHIAPILISGNERDERARTGLAVGQDLGIFEIDRAYSPAFVDAGYLHNLDDLISTIGADQFTVGTRQVIGGHDYIFPYGGGPFCCWYRTDLSGGVVPATIDDLKSISKANTGGGRYGISLATGGPVAVADTMPMFVWSFGGDYFDTKGNVIYGSDNVMQAVQAVTDLLKFAPPGNSNWSAFKHIDNFLSGLVALSPWAGRLGVNAFEKKSPVESKASVTPPPWGPQRIGLTRWSTLAIDKKTAYPDDAKKFIQFLLTGDAGVAYANSVPGQLVPAIKSVRDAAAADQNNDFIKAHPDWVKTLYDQADKGTDYGGPMGAVASGTLKLYNGPGAPWSQTAFGANNIDMQMLQKITLQNMSPKDAHQWATDQYKSIVKDYKSKHPSWKPYNG